MSYAITARADGAALRQTRTQPASAAVLGMRWAKQGHVDVRIIADGKTYDLEAFRKRLGQMKVSPNE